MAKKSNFIVACLAALIALSLISCTNQDAGKANQAPQGFILSSELSAQSGSKLSLSFFDNKIAFMAPGFICIYQTHIEDSDYIIEYEGEYYINEERYLELVEIAALAEEKRRLKYKIGDTIEILGEDKYYNIAITGVEETMESDNVKLFDISFSFTEDVSESELKSLFSFVEIKVGSENGTDNMFEFIDMNTVRLKMKPDRILESIILKSPKYSGLEYRVVVD